MYSDGWQPQCSYGISCRKALNSHLSENSDEKAEDQSRLARLEALPGMACCNKLVIFCTLDLGRRIREI